MSRQPILLLDVMETLVTEPFYTVFPEFFGLTMEQLFEQKHPTGWIEFEKGALSEQEYLDGFFLDGRSVDGDGLKRALAEHYEWLDGMEALVKQLHAAGFSMYALSNYSVWYQLIEDKLQLSRFLDWQFVSCHTGVRKPDRESYMGAVQALGVSPQDCLFIDDREVNIIGARDCGMDAIHRQNTPQVRSELARRGILT